MLVIPVLERLRQEDHKFETNLDYCCQRFLSHPVPHAFSLKEKHTEVYINYKLVDLSAQNSY